MAAAKTKTLKCSASSSASFEVLVRKVKETFALGRRRVRQEIVHTYWKAGRYIHAHMAGSTVRPSAPQALIQYEGEDFLYLNNELLLRRLAVRMKD